MSQNEAISIKKNEAMPEVSTSNTAQQQIAQDETSKSFFTKSVEMRKSDSTNNNVNLDSNRIEQKTDEKEATGKEAATTPSSLASRFLAIHLIGSLEAGYFKSVNNVYVKYTIISGPDWILSAGTDVGITQISRYNGIHVLRNNWRKFAWNQPISVSYRSYNYYGWPQIVLSVYYFDTFGNDQILGYGATHLPISSQLPSDFSQQVEIYSPQSSSMAKQLVSWLTGKKPELVDSSMFARSECRRVLQVVRVGRIELKFNLTSKDVSSNGYKS